MLSEEVKGVLKKNLKVIQNDIPSKEILQDLHIEGVISSTEVENLKKFDTDKERNFALVEILKKRSDRDFVKFCIVLKQHETELVAALGKDLEQQVHNCNGQSAASNLATNNKQDNFESYFDIVANELAREDIFRFGIKLHLSSKSVQEIINDITIHKSYDKIFQILLLWKNEKGKSADINEVINALRSMKKNFIADSLQESYDS